METVTAPATHENHHRQTAENGNEESKRHANPQTGADKTQRLRFGGGGGDPIWRGDRQRGEGEGRQSAVVLVVDEREREMGESRLPRERERWEGDVQSRERLFSFFPFFSLMARKP